MRKVKDDFENIRAERDTPLHRQAPTNSYSGLWKQIALGIIVGYTVLGIMSAIGWFISIKLAMGSLQITIP
ncbi:hypothetical protein D9M71_760620 [compost metagenome]|jgi:hypothetical protein